MPVDTFHADFEKAAPDWEIMRHCLAGERAVKDAGTHYLPKLSEQTDQEFDAYKMRAKFFNATARTHESLCGLVFRKDPNFTFPDSMAGFQEDATLTGVSMYDYAKHVVREVLGVGRAGTLVDFDATKENRPYVVPYSAENIVNWKCERRNGRITLTLLVLHELDPEWIPLTEGERREGAPDEFEQGQFDQWRVYRIREDGAGGAFVDCTVYRKKDAEKKKGEPEFVPIAQFTPTRRGRPLSAIPFVFHGAENAHPGVGKIPLLDLALVNLAHYRTSADLENGRHFTGLPVPWAAGFELPQGETLNIGSSTAWVTANENAKCGFLEFTGQGLSALKEAIEECERQMIALGAKMMEPEAKKAEAYDTVAMRAAAETSALMTATVTTTQTLSDVMQWVAWWLGTAETPDENSEAANVELNTEFVIQTLTPEQVNALVAAYNGAAMDWDSFFWKMKQGEMFPPDAEPEKVRAAIEANPPGIIAMTAPPAPAGGGGGA